jgi:hypothetical protein
LVRTRVLEAYAHQAPRGEWSLLYEQLERTVEETILGQNRPDVNRARQSLLARIALKLWTVKHDHEIVRLTLNAGESVELSLAAGKLDIPYERRES